MYLLYIQYQEIEQIGPQAAELDEPMVTGGVLQMTYQAELNEDPRVDRLLAGRIYRGGVLSVRRESPDLTAASAVGKSCAPAHAPRARRA